MRALTKCLLITILISACYDDPLAVDAPIEGEVAPAEPFSDTESHDAQQARATVDFFTPRLVIDFHVESTLTPKTPITVQLSAVAVEPVTGGTVQVILPTQAAMEHAGTGQRLRYPPNTNLPVAAHWQLPAMRAGDRWSKSFSVGALEEGYYHIAVEADARGPETARGSYLIDDSYAETWVFVKDGGGRLTERFDESVFPRGIAPQPGPFRARGRSPGGASASEAAMDSDGSDVYAEVVYYDKGVKKIAKGAYVSVILREDDDEDDWSGSESRYVPSSGIVSFTCPGTGYMLDGGATLPSTSEVGAGTFNSYWDAYPSDCGDTVQVVGTRYTYLPWDHLKKAIPLIDGAFYKKRSRISWRVKGSRLGSSSYDPDEDEIVFGGTYYSRWTAAHEYTHALHEESLGGIWTAERACYLNTRQPWRATGYKCALLEGIADYGGNIGAPSDRRRVGDLESWDDDDIDPDDIPGQVEGRVAALFHDLFDSANEGNDETTYSGRYIMQVFKSCRVQHSGQWYKRNDVSDFVWCLENRVNSSVHNSNFPALPAPTAVSESATEPGNHDEDDIRDTWLQNVGR